MKILISTDTYYPMINGVVVSINNLYKELKLRGHDVRILTLSSKGKGYIEGDVYYLSSYNIHVYPEAKIIKPSKIKILKDIIEWAPDIIHSQSEFSILIATRYLKRKLMVPHIHTYHTLYEDYLHYFVGGQHFKRIALTRLSNLLLSRFNLIIAPSEKTKKVLLNYDLSTPIEIVPTGIDLDKFRLKLSEDEKHSLMSKFDLPLNAPVLIYIGRIAQEKNIEEILFFFKNILSTINNVQLLIVGAGPHLDQLKSIVSNYGIEDNVKFTGMVDVNQVKQYYQLGDVFVTASTSETQGLTYIEALASGLPILCRKDASIEDLIINGKNGYTYSNENEFKESLKMILSDKNIKPNQDDIEDLYSLKTFGDKVYSIYDQFVKNR